MVTPYDPNVAIAALSRADPKLARIISRVGPFALRMRGMASPFGALLRSIVYQQISGKAAASIHTRLLARFPRRRPSATRLLELSDAELRAAGMSRGKCAAARDLARKTLARGVPSRRRLEQMGDEEIIECLTEIRGIGRWTAQMLLIFHLGRPDILPATDLGVRNGFQRSHGGDALPEPAALLAFGARWKPYRSVASWYLWRATEL